MALEELHDLKEVWSELSKVWEQIDQMKEQPWVSVQPRKVQAANETARVARRSVLQRLKLLLVLFAASSESRRSSEPAEELPGTTETIRLLRVCPEAAEGIPEGQDVFGFAFSIRRNFYSFSNSFPVPPFSGQHVGD